MKLNIIERERDYPTFAHLDIGQIFMIASDKNTVYKKVQTIVERSGTEHNVVVMGECNRKYIFNYIVDAALVVPVKIQSMTVKELE